MKSKKSLGLLASISIGVGGMIGAGIFSVLGTAAGIAGNAMYIPFLIAGIIALMNTYSYSKLGIKYPSAGGPVQFLTQGFGRGLLSGGFNILLWIGYIFVLALYARAFASYGVSLFSSNTSQLWLHVFITGIIVLFTLINATGAQAVGRAELVIVGIKVGILLLFIIIGMFFVQPALFAVKKYPSISNIAFCSAMVFVAYEGFGLITNAGDDMKKPEKTMPKALYLSVIVTMIIYILTSFTVIGNLPVNQILEAKDHALAMAAKPFLGNIGFTVIGIAALFSTSSAINATLYGGANVSYTIAKQGELPDFFERKVWEESKEGLYITAVLVILIANFFNLQNIAMLGSAIFLLIYTSVNIGHLNIHKQTNANPYMIGLSILVNTICFVVLIYHEIQHSVITVAFLILVTVLAFIIEYIYQNWIRKE